MSEKVRNSNCVFVGSIPYDATEEQLIEVFSQAGPVVSFRLVFDKENGKSKGYGFCEFRDPQTAASAIRNLNGTEFNGRNLRVDVADQDTRGTKQPSKKETFTAPAPQAEAPSFSSTQPAAPGSAESVNNMLEGMSNTQIYDLVAKMKSMVQNNPDEARQILLNNPSLAYTVIKAQSMLGMITPSLMQKVLIAKPTPVPQPTIPMPPMPSKIAPIMPSPLPSKVVPMMPPPMPMPGPMIGMSPFGFPMPMGGFDLNLISQLPEQQKAVLQMVLSLSPQQIEQLPIEQRAGVIQLKQTLANMRMG